MGLRGVAHSSPESARATWASCLTVREHVLAALERHGPVNARVVTFGPRGVSVVRGGQDLAVAHVRRDTLANLLIDADTLAREAAAKVARESKSKSPECPVCAVQIVPGVRCEVCRNIEARAKDAAAGLAAPVMIPQHVADAHARGERTPLPEGWTWHARWVCTAVSLDGRYAGIGHDTGGMYSDGNPPHEVLVAVGREALRLRLRLGCHDLLLAPMIRAKAADMITEASVYGLRCMDDLLSAPYQAFREELRARVDV